MSVNEKLQPVCAWCGRLSADRSAAVAHAQVCTKSPLVARIEELTAQLTPWHSCVTALADEVDVLVRKHVIDSRSPAADALLDVRNVPSTPRSDRLLQLEAIYDAMGLVGEDRSVDGVRGYVVAQQDAIRLQRQRADDAESELVAVKEGLPEPERLARQSLDQMSRDHERMQRAEDRAEDLSYKLEQREAHIKTLLYTLSPALLRAASLPGFASEIEALRAVYPKETKES